MQERPEMNRPLMMKAFPRAAAWVAVIALGGAIALAQATASSNGTRSDGQIEMDVVHALDGSQALKNDLITAATIQSEVTLSGTVSSDASKQLAESIVSKVPGVSKVNNHLKVGNPAEDSNAQNAQAAPSEPDDDNRTQQPRNPPQYADQGNAPADNAPERGAPPLS